MRWTDTDGKSLKMAVAAFVGCFLYITWFSSRYPPQLATPFVPDKLDVVVGRVFPVVSFFFSLHSQFTAVSAAFNSHLTFGVCGNDLRSRG